MARPRRHHARPDPLPGRRGLRDAGHRGRSTLLGAMAAQSHGRTPDRAAPRGHRLRHRIHGGPGRGIVGRTPRPHRLLESPRRDRPLRRSRIRQLAADLHATPQTRRPCRRIPALGLTEHLDMAQNRRHMAIRRPDATRRDRAGRQSGMPDRQVLQPTRPAGPRARRGRTIHPHGQPPEQGQLRPHARPALQQLESQNRHRPRHERTDRSGKGSQKTPDRTRQRPRRRHGREIRKPPRNRPRQHRRSKNQRRRGTRRRQPDPDHGVRQDDQRRRRRTAIRYARSSGTATNATCRAACPERSNHTSAWPAA